jgi:peptidoglycan/LPS O-acetylase OafA/YrhL
MSVETLDQTHSDDIGDARLTGSVHLDSIRGLSSIFVFLCHFRPLFFVDFRDNQNRSIISKLFYLVDGFGHTAVIVFFVLSGYFIASSVERAVRTDKWSWLWYTERRLTRLYVVLIPALFLGAALDSAGLHFFGDKNAYGAMPEFHDVTLPIANHLSLGIWLGNLAFLQGIICPVFGTNGPLWSLAYEFWYYVIFPLGLFAIAGAIRPTARVVNGCMAIGLLLFVGKQIDLYFSIWLIGAGITGLKITQSSRFRLSKAMRNLGWLIGVIGLGACLYVTRIRAVHAQFLLDLATAIFVSILIIMILNFARKTPNALYMKAARTLSGLSYTLYLTHTPFLVFLCAACIGSKARWQMDAKHLLMGLGLVVATFVYAAVVWRLTEANTNLVRNAVQRLRFGTLETSSSPSKRKA